MELRQGHVAFTANTDRVCSLWVPYLGPASSVKVQTWTPRKIGTLELSNAKLSQLAHLEMLKSS